MAILTNSAWGAITYGILDRRTTGPSVNGMIAEVPLLVRIPHDINCDDLVLTAGWTVPMANLVAAAIIQGVAAFGAGRKGQV
jgi:hypothetical protein